jgi:hypothetical protein
MPPVSDPVTNLSPEVLAALANTPAIPPPDNVESNFVDPYRKIVLSGVSYRVNSIKTTWGSQKSDIVSKGTGTYPEPDALKSTDEKYAQYFSLNDMTTTTSTITNVMGNSDGTLSGNHDATHILSNRTFEVERG